MSDMSMEKLHAECQQVRDNILRCSCIALNFYETGEWKRTGRKTWKEFVRKDLGKTMSEINEMIELGREAREHPGCKLGSPAKGESRWIPALKDLS